MVKSSCTSITGRSTSVIKVGVAYVNVCVLSCLKEELAWVIDKRLWAISTKMLLKTVVPLETKNKADLNLEQYCMRCYVCDP